MLCIEAAILMEQQSLHSHVRAIPMMTGDIITCGVLFKKAAWCIQKAQVHKLDEAVAVRFFQAQLYLQQRKLSSTVLTLPNMTPNFRTISHCQQCLSSYCKYKVMRLTSKVYFWGYCLGWINVYTCNYAYKFFRSQIRSDLSIIFSLSSKLLPLYNFKQNRYVLKKHQQRFCDIAPMFRPSPPASATSNYWLSF